MSKSIPNGKMDERRHIQAIPVLFTLTAMIARSGRVSRSALTTKGRLEGLSCARAEAQVRMGRWNS